jgi:hypothetical protein
MANEPDNLILIHLREIRHTLAEHSERFVQIDKRFNDVDKRFNEMDKRFDEMRLLLGHTIGVAQSSYLRAQEFDQRYEFGEGEQRQLRQRVDELERRIAKIEDERND